MDSQEREALVAEEAFIILPSGAIPEVPSTAAYTT